MKKFFLIYFLSLHTLSELTLEITQGTEDPYRVAIIEFSGSNDTSTDIQSVDEIPLFLKSRKVSK